MTTKYDKSQQEVVKLAAILKQGESLPDHAESQSLATLVRTGFHTVIDIMKKQQEEFSTNCINPNREISQDFKDELEASEIALNEIVLACHNQSLQDQGVDVLDKALISSFYDYTDDDYTERVVKESDIRSIPIFYGDKPSPDIYMEQLLLQINQAGLQLKLNEAGLISVLFKRLGGKALQVIQSQMQLLNLSMDTIKFTQLVSLCENCYMKKSTPKSAKLALHQMPKLPSNNKNFMELEASIVRLARLSCRDVIDEKERDILFKSRSLEQFLACLQPGDKILLDKQNTARLSSGLDFLTLHASVQFLENHYRDNDTGKTPLFEYEDSSVNRIGMDQTQDEFQYEDDGQNVFWVNRGRPMRGRYMSRGFPPRQSFRGGQRPPLRPPISQNRFAYNRYPSAPELGAKPKNFNYNPRQQAHDGPVPQSAQRGRRQPDKFDKMDKFPTSVKYSHDKLNIADKSCFLCGVPGHKWTDLSCVYNGTPLMDTPCRKCHHGGHLTKLCIGPIQAAVSAYKKQKEADKLVRRHGQNSDANDNDVGNLDEFLDQLEVEN